MSRKGREKRAQRLVKEANRHLLMPFEKKTPHDKKLWTRGTSALLRDLAKAEEALE